MYRATRYMLNLFIITKKNVNIFIDFDERRRHHTAGNQCKPGVCLPQAACDAHCRQDEPLRPTAAGSRLLQIDATRPMRISELVQKTGVPKETIHFYLREGLLRKPRKSGANAADYTKSHLERILLIKELRDSFYLPIPEIKKILKQARRQSPSDQAVSDFHNKYFRPLERLLSTEIVGRDAFCEATGLGRKWLATMESWDIITHHEKDGEPVYSRDDLIIGRLMVDMDQLGFGPKDGYDPKELKRIADFIRQFVRSAHREYYQRNLERLSSAEMDAKGSRFAEIMSLFFYHIYRKLVREEYRRLRTAMRSSRSRRRCLTGK
jgi:DNA-binding transcriptional MerR regulator